MAHAKRRQFFAIVECLIAFGGAIDEIVQDHDIAGLDVLLQWSRGSGGNDMGAANVLQCPHIGPIVDIWRHNRMLAAMTSQKHTLDSIDFAID